jgi:PhnB protein
MNTVKPFPDNYPRVTPHLSIENAASALEYYTNVLGATERMRMDAPRGAVAHAEIELGSSVIMIGEAALPNSDPSPKALGGTPVSLFVYVENVDDVFRRAVDGGATVVSEPEEHFYGDRVATIDDPFGHRWNLATHVEDLSPQELERRAAQVTAS